MTKKSLKELSKLLKQISRQNAELVRTIQAASRKSIEINNYFGSDSRARVYNGRMTGKLTKKTMKTRKPAAINNSRHLNETE